MKQSLRFFLLLSSIIYGSYLNADQVHNDMSTPDAHTLLRISQTFIDLNDEEWEYFNDFAFEGFVAFPRIMHDSVQFTIETVANNDEVIRIDEYSWALSRGYKIARKKNTRALIFHLRMRLG